MGTNAKRLALAALCAIAGAAGCGDDPPAMTGPGGGSPIVMGPGGGSIAPGAGGPAVGTAGTTPINPGTPGGAAGTPAVTAGGGALPMAGATGAAGNPNPGMAGNSGMAGAPGTAGGGAMAGMTGGTGIPPVTGGVEPKLPMITEMCPMLQEGMITVMGQQVQLWVGQKQEGKKGAVFFYWHGTGSRSTEATGGLGTAIQEIKADGGIVASFTTTTSMGMNTGNNVWYTGDFAMADIILVCATQQLNIETKRIYTGGCSAGGLQAGAMVYGRSSYLAAAMPNSGGVVRGNALQDPMHVPALITTHGAMGTDVVIIDFSTTSLTQCRDIAAKGGLAVDCDHGGRHCASPAEVKRAQWQFLKDHPFGAPSPYMGTLPSTFPAFCKIIK